MIASAQIVGTLRAIPDAASAPPHPIAESPRMRISSSVLEQYHSPRESASERRMTPRHGPAETERFRNTSSTPLAKPADNLPAIQVPNRNAAVETPRLILPFTTSITLRQDTTASPDDTATLDSTTATDPTPQSSSTTSGTPSGTATTLLTPVIFRSTLDLSSLPLVSDSKSTSVPAANPVEDSDERAG